MARTNKPITEQIVESSKKSISNKEGFDGNTEKMISTGSTLLDLSITGGRKRGGGLPSCIFIEVSGPESSGKSVLLSELAGAIQRQGGTANFKDPEGTLNESFAAIFGMKLDEKEYSKPDTVSQVFTEIREWEPPTPKKINGLFVDSLAALSTNLEMDNETGDKMGQRRAKEFSEGFRKTCRILNKNNWLMVASNQIRDKIGVTFGKKTDTPGGWAIKFYSSVRLEFTNIKKIYKIIKVHGKEVRKTIGTEVTVNVIKNKCWKPFGSAVIFIIFDYGIDDIRANLQYIKDFTKNTTYQVNNKILNVSLDKSIAMVEHDDLVNELKEQVIDLWESIESKFESNRKRKQR